MLDMLILVEAYIRGRGGGCIYYIPHESHDFTKRSEEDLLLFAKFWVT
jgi:hypothetical protein